MNTEHKSLAVLLFTMLSHDIELSFGILYYKMDSCEGTRKIIIVAAKDAFLELLAVDRKGMP